MGEAPRSEAAPSEPQRRAPPAAREGGSPDRGRRLSVLAGKIERATGAPFLEGHSVDVLPSGEPIAEGMYRAICAAEQSIDMLSYIWWPGIFAERIRDALIARAEAGVKARLLLDAFGSRLEDEDEEALAEAGVEVRWFRPPRYGLFIPLHRTHRKILVVDEACALTGGVGIADAWWPGENGEPPWREVQLAIRGPAVSLISGAFTEEWTEAEPDARQRLVVEQSGRRQGLQGENQVAVLRSAWSSSSNDMELAVLALIQAAEEELLLSTAYLVPSPIAQASLVNAVARGVRVRVVIPGIDATDQRVCNVAGGSAFAPLIDAGVELLQFEETMLHGKALVIDEQIALVGSPNLNYRSLRKDDELAVCVAGPAAARVAAEIEGWMESASPVDLREWRRRSWARRLGEALAHPFRRHL